MYWTQIVDKTIGAAQPNVNGKKLAEIQLPVPPIAEQNRITDFFDKLKDKTEKILSEQKSKLENLKALKSSILDSAFKGEI